MSYGGKRRRIEGRPIVREDEGVGSAISPAMRPGNGDELTSGMDPIVLSTSFNQRRSLLSDPGERYRF